MTTDAKQQAVSCYEDILLALLKAGTPEDEYSERVYEMPLAVKFRSGWYSLEDGPSPSEYEIMLVWGGPSVKIVGGCHNGRALTAHLEYQDWGIPWTKSDIHANTLLCDFANYFMEN